MDKVVRFFCSWILAISFLQNAFGYCPESGKMGWTVSGDVFYWIGHEQGLGYTNKPANVLTTDNFTKTSAIQPSFDWDWGLRLGAAFTPCAQPWTYQGYWTYFQSKAHAKTAVNSGAPDFLGTFPIWSMGPDTLVGDYVSSSSESWHLNANLLDFVIQYSTPFFQCNRFSFMPFIGARGSLLNQKLTAKYTGGTFFSGTDDNHLQCRFLGGGPRLGLNAQCELALGFSLFGRAAVAPQFGYSRITQNENYLGNQRFHRSHIDHHLLLSADYEAGFRWKGLMIEEKPYVILGLAWEAQEFFYANRLYRGPYRFFTKNRDLFLQGLTASVALEF